VADNYLSFSNPAANLNAQVAFPAGTQLLDSNIFLMLVILQCRIAINACGNRYRMT
jgi:hypothetical protein